MEDETLDKRAEGVLSLTFDQVADALDKLRHTAPCSTCGKKDWVLGSYDGRPNMVNMPLANAEGLAHWAFYLTCDTCGAVKFIDAARLGKAVNAGSTANV